MYDTNSQGKQVPKARPASAIGKATTPAEETFTSRPNYVLVNRPGIYGFSYEFSGSHGNTHADVGKYTTGSVVPGGGDTGSLNPGFSGPIRLDIQPIAWRQTSAAYTAAVGDVTFVYQGDVG